jgi:hypothetical protein
LLAVGKHATEGLREVNIKKGLKKIGIFSSPLRPALPKCYYLDVVGGPSTPYDPESDAGGSLSSWQGHPSREGQG